MKPLNPFIFCGGFLIFLLYVLMAAGPMIAPHDPCQVNLEWRLTAPNPVYPLGTDHLGRCLWSRIIHGARNSLFGSLVAISLALMIGFCAGTLAGMSSSGVDTLLMRICDVFLAFPFMILAIILSGMMGPSLKSLIVGIGIAGWAWWARFIRGMVLSAREKDFVKAAVSMGTGTRRLIWKYILPQILPQLLVSIPFMAGRIIVVMSGLSYLGLGVQAPIPEWGNMLKESRLYMAQAPWLVIAPGMAVSLSVLAFTLLGEGFRDYFQVKPAGQW
jgi:ABC-type dipeptide/oligopeptide/nickel transport system permease subunit